MKSATMRLENQLHKEGKIFVCGIDEVGRGCIAGPLVAAAVVMPVRYRLKLRDSKQLTFLTRIKLAEKIRSKALAYGIGWVDNKEIDQLGLTKAITLAYERALEDLPVAVSLIIVDGNYDYLLEYGISQTIIKADQKVNCVAAASIIAKVARDEYMHTISKKMPAYGFDKNVGYATQAHQEAIKTNGLSDIHRKSFCTKLI